MPATGLSRNLELLDYVRDDASKVSRVGNVDVIEKEEGKDISICHIGIFFAFSVQVAGTRIPFLSSGAAPAGVAATLLAMDMINKGDGSVIKELDGINETCPIRFTLESFDTAASSAVALNKFLEVLDRDTAKGERELCAVEGAFLSSSSVAMSLLGGAREIPQISPVSTSVQLDDKDLYPMFARVGASSEGIVIPFLLYLRKSGVRHLGVIHSSDEYGTSFKQALLENAARLFPEMRIVTVDIPVSNRRKTDYEEAVGILQRTGFRWFFGMMIGFQDYEPIMTEALNQGIVGSGYVWQFGAGMGRTNLADVMIEKGSPIELATEGVGVIGGVGGHTGGEVYENFLERWREMDNDHDLDIIRSKQPTFADQPDYVPHSVDSAMFEYDPSYFITFNFDSMVMLGLAACKAAAKGKSTLSFDGKTMYDEILNTSFYGATGHVILDPVTGTRDPSSAQFRLLFYEKHEVNSTHVEFVLPLNENFENGKWTLVGQPYVYHGGSTNVPPDLPPLDKTNFNYIGTGLRAAGLTMASVILVLSMGFASWTLYNKNDYVVMASQPIFLLILCVGAFIMGATIIPLSIDDEIASANGCSVACMAVPWLASTGFVIMFSALFSKTLRVNKLFNNPSFRRVKVTAFDVMKPLLVLFAVNLVVLSVWTAVSPLKWRREVTVNDRFDRIVESRGFCHVTEEDKFLPFVIVIVVVDIGALIFASYQSYLARGISTEFAESEYIAKAIACMSLVSFVGVPTMIIVSEETRARYFVLTSIIFVLCGSVLLFIFVPKILYARAQHGSSGIKGNIRSNADRMKRRESVAAGDAPTDGAHRANPERRPSALLRMIASLRRSNEFAQSRSQGQDMLAKGEVAITQESGNGEVKISQISMVSEFSENGPDASDSDRGIRIVGNSQRMIHVESENESLREVIDSMRSRILELESLLGKEEAMPRIEEEYAREKEVVEVDSV